MGPAPRKTEPTNNVDCFSSRPFGSISPETDSNRSQVESDLIRLGSIQIQCGMDQADALSPYHNRKDTEQHEEEH